ncbi:TNF receptor-associated factor 6-like [Sycon ciliatum]|uniref:TNF receptor-associated factor 6-like n=1 Tax=Sycon ciliatum TaxID=27933 RepID=UPI0020A86D3C
MSRPDYTRMFPPLSLGFDLEVFVEEPDLDRFQCPMCLGVIRNPVLVTVCGHHFCEDCITEWLKNRRTCPLDKRNVPFGRIAYNFEKLRHIGQLKVFCERKEVGCPWTGPLCTYESHKDSDNCQIACLCGLLRSWRETEPHQNCPKDTIRCPFTILGCEHSCMREDLEQHLLEQSRQHNVSIALNMDILSSRLMQLAVSPAEPQETIYTEIFHRIELHNGPQVTSDPFYSGPCGSGYRLRMIIKPSNSADGPTVYYSIIQGRNDEQLAWPFRHNVIVQCLHITEDHVIKEATLKPSNDQATMSRRYTRRGRPNFLSTSQLEEAGVTTYNMLRIRFIVRWDRVPIPRLA